MLLLLLNASTFGVLKLAAPDPKRLARVPPEPRVVRVPKEVRFVKV